MDYDRDKDEQATPITERSGGAMLTQLVKRTADYSKKLSHALNSKIRCPRCNSDAWYKYGKTKNQKDRYLCLVCNRQFVPGTKREEPVARPTCPTCGKTMHVYMRNSRYTRFRCADYPECRTFLKLMKEENR